MTDGVSPRSHEWTQEERDEFGEAMRFLFEWLSWDVLVRLSGVSVGTLHSYRDARTATPTPRNRDRVMRLYERTRALVSEFSPPKD